MRTIHIMTLLFSDTVVEKAACLWWELEIERQNCEQAEAEVVALRQQLMGGRMGGGMGGINKELKCLLAVRAKKKKEFMQLVTRNQKRAERERSGCKLFTKKLTAFTSGHGET